MNKFFFAILLLAITSIEGMTKNEVETLIEETKKKVEENKKKNGISNIKLHFLLTNKLKELHKIKQSLSDNNNNNNNNADLNTNIQSSIEAINDLENQQKNFSEWPSTKFDAWAHKQVEDCKTEYSLFTKFINETQNNIDKKITDAMNQVTTYIASLPDKIANIGLISNNNADTNDNSSTTTPPEIPEENSEKEDIDHIEKETQTQGTQTDIDENGTTSEAPNNQSNNLSNAAHSKENIPVKDELAGITNKTSQHHIEKLVIGTLLVIAGSYTVYRFWKNKKNNASKKN